MKEVVVGKCCWDPAPTFNIFDAFTTAHADASRERELPTSYSRFENFKGEALCQTTEPKVICIILTESNNFESNWLSWTRISDNLFHSSKFNVTHTWRLRIVRD